MPLISYEKQRLKPVDLCLKWNFLGWFLPKQIIFLQISPDFFPVINDFSISKLWSVSSSLRAACCIKLQVLALQVTFYLEVLALQLHATKLKLELHFVIENYL